MGRDAICSPSSLTAGAACLLLLFLQGWGDRACRVRSSFCRAPKFIPLSHFFTLSLPRSFHFCFLPSSLHPFFSSSSSLPGSSVRVEVHVRSVPTRFSQPTLVSPPCPELPKGDKCIGDPRSLSGPRGRGLGTLPSATGSSPSAWGVGGNKRGGKKPRRSPLRVQVSINTFVDKLRATLPLPCPFG